MKKSLLSPLMIAGLVLVMVLAGGCNRPDQQATLDTPVPVVQNPLPPAAAPTATLPSGEMPVDLAATLTATGPQPEAATPVPAAVPEVTPQATAEQPPAVVVVNTPAAPTLAPLAPAAPTLAPVSPSGERLHTVQPGERLFSIARLYNVNPYAIAQLNAIPAPYWIYPGQSLKIPGGGVSVTPVPPVGGSSYTVLPGDSLFRIALRYGKSMQSIAAANGIVNYNLIYPGQVLRIP